eukprot:TRINITY_DN11253_c0_g1_i1.p1 TRINITY_DN11253_c0_g1~~TRINITY_DN11253_c0_g1_i1.p1  ORF type:complete len:427 (-),score=76.99 TRINITY_DN11253_c0_g1_i1:94-1374(-)
MMVDFLAAANGDVSFREQQAQIRNLQAGLSNCCNELDVLRECLAIAGILSPERFSAQLHRRHFEAVRSAAADGAPASMMAYCDFADVLRDIVLPLGLLSGPTALEAMASSSKSTAPIVRQVLRVVRDACPCCFYVFGGGDLSCPMRSVELYDTAACRWEMLPPMAEARWSPATAVLGGRLYVCGGGDGTTALNSVERFDPSRGSWEYVAPLRERRYWACAGVLEGRLLVCGGEGLFEESLGTAEAFVADADTDNDNFDIGRWVFVPPMFERRKDLMGCSLNGVFYVCGGFDTQDDALSSVERYDPIVGHWGVAPSMRQGRAQAAAAIVAGRLWVCGGKADRSRRLTSVECFDPAVGAWEIVAPMLASRGGAAAAAYANRLYVFGGFDGSGALASAEMYDLDLGMWVPLPMMTARRWGTTALAWLQR